MENLDNIKLDELINNLNEDNIISNPIEKVSNISNLSMSDIETNIAIKKINEYIDSEMDKSIKQPFPQQSRKMRNQKQVKIIDDRNQEGGIISKILSDTDISFGNRKFPKRTIYLIVILILVGVGIWFLTKKFKNLDKKTEQKLNLKNEKNNKKKK